MDRIFLVHTKDIFGNCFLVDINDHIGYHIYVKGYFDLFCIGFAEQALPKGSLIIDVGANIGSVSIPLATRGYSVGCFDASPGACGLLLQNIALNPNARAFVVNVASVPPEKYGKWVALHTPRGNAGATSLIANWNSGKADDLTFHAFGVSVGKVILSITNEAVALVKIDVEGAEDYVIHSLLPIIEEQSPFIMFEWRPDLLSMERSSAQWLTGCFGYHLFGTNVRRVSLTDVSVELDVALESFNPRHAYENVLALPKNGLAAITNGPFSQVTAMTFRIPRKP